MTAPIFPTLPGIAWPVVKAPIWSTVKNEVVSGKRSRFAMWSYPQYRYTLTFQFLRNNSAEMQTLMGFVDLVNGAAGIFQFNDPDDNSTPGAGGSSPTLVQVGIGDGATTSFQLYRSLGGIWYDPVFCVTGSPQVFINGVLRSPSISTTGVATFGIAPAAGSIISWSGTFNWYCRFDDDTADFEKWVSTFYRLKKLTFTTEKYIQ